MQVEGIQLPPKPKSRYSERIRNNGVGVHSDSTGLMRNQDNVAQEIQLAGYGFFPSLCISSMVHSSNIE